MSTVLVAAGAAGGLLAFAVLLATSSGDGRAPPDPQRTARPWLGLRRRLPSARAQTAQAPDPDVALVCDLVAAAVTAGLPPGRALGAALDALAAAGYREDPGLRRASVQLSWGTGAETVARDVSQDREAPWRELAEPLLLSARTGAAAAGLLSSAAASVRARRRWEVEAAAARLTASLVLPLGLCTLPAFLLLGVVPVVLSLATELLG